MSVASQSISSASSLLRACVMAGAAFASLAIVAAEPGYDAVKNLQTLDAARKVLFVTQADGSVRVLNLRNTVSELGVLRARQRHAVREIKLGANGQHLWVQGDDALYLYDAHSLRLLQRQAHALAHVASASEPAANPSSGVLR